ncbi:MAG TPA: hypothetical protein DD655_05835, partial [Halieaceae bacterium]|nr:hypothetical protein [Halieaceae bacterium]
SNIAAFGVLASGVNQQLTDRLRVKHVRKLRSITASPVMTLASTEAGRVKQDGPMQHRDIFVVRSAENAK